MKVEQELRRIFFQKASKENGFSEEEEGGRRCGIEDQQEGGRRKPGKDDTNADYNDHHDGNHLWSDLSVKLLVGEAGDKSKDVQPSSFHGALGHLSYVVNILVFKHSLDSVDNLLHRVKLCVVNITLVHISNVHPWDAWNWENIRDDKMKGRNWKQWERKAPPAKSRNTLKSVSDGITPDWKSSCPITCVCSSFYPDQREHHHNLGNHRAKGKRSWFTISR